MTHVPMLPALRAIPSGPPVGRTRHALRLREAYCTACPWTADAGRNDGVTLDRADWHSVTTGHETRVW